VIEYNIRKACILEVTHDNFYGNIIKKAEILIEALPYIRKLYGKTVSIINTAVMP
jgi:hypothetical protein